MFKTVGILGTVYKVKEGKCSSVFKSDQPVIWTPRYSLFYIKMYRIVYRAVYSALYSLVFSASMW